MADYVGSNSNDVLFLDGHFEHITMTITDPYTGTSYFIDEDKNFNMSTYDGLNGTDSIFMTYLGDVLLLESPVDGAQTVFNVERFFAADGGDVIHLASVNYVLDDVWVDGGAGDDIILSNAGDDLLNGRFGDDIISGGPGNDVLNGSNAFIVESGSDTLNGGSGMDILRGEDGDDTLIYFVDGTFEEYYAYNIGSPGVEGTAHMLNVEGSNLSLDIFDGGNDYDILQMTDGDDTLFLNDPFHAHHPDAGSLQLIGIEQIDAGAGNDVIDLTHDTLAYGDILINGGDGNDTLWASAGNDTLNGDAGNDELFGGFGDDMLNGGADADILYGSLGNDILRGGAGNDILYGGADRDSEYVQIMGNQHLFADTVTFPDLRERVDIMDLVPSGENALGIATGNLSVDYQTTATISFVETGAGYNNSLGFYKIATDGTILDVELAFPNVKTIAPGTTATIDLPGAPDTDFGFFVIADGARKNNDYSKFDLEHGTFQFVYHHGKGDERLANITDAEKDISLVFFDGGKDKTVVGSNNHIYHSTERDGPTNLNSDGDTHVVSGVMEGSDGGTLRIGFEDLPNLGDADYNDVVFDLTVEGEQTVTILEADGDVLDGGAGDDFMDGGIGDDILYGGEGADTLYGNQGGDLFLFKALSDAGDTIMDFSLAEGDMLNLTDVLQGFDALQDDINAFVHLADNGSGGTDVRVDADGQGGDFVTLATVAGGLGGLNAADLLDSGHLVADQSVTL